jgi:glutamyl-tRNA synthetase/glutamyl-Q tRNA(Asp) synthetase
VNAVFVWGLSRACGGRVALRIEDHDRGRCRTEYAQGIADDLAWLGLSADVAPIRQSERGALYASAAETLHGVYACSCSRRDIADIAGDTGALELRYPGTCRTKHIPFTATTARRVPVDRGIEMFDDIAHGPQMQDPDAQCGDVLIRDRLGNWTYQFAVVVDDIDQHIDVVIRGDDLLTSTGRQLRIARLLGRATPPVYLHHPLILRADGAKLSKSDGATGLRDLRAAGWSAERVLGEAARLAGLWHGGTVSATDLPHLFR